MNTRSFAIEHLRLRLKPLNRALNAAVERQAKIAARLLRPEMASLCITDDQVKILLGDVEVLLHDGIFPGVPAELLPSEVLAQDELRRQSSESGIVLPMDRLAKELHLSDFELEALLLCAAPELDRSYERIYAYILDDMNRRSPCIELLCSLTSQSLVELLHRHHVLSRFGRLRRTAILRAWGEPTTELRQKLRLAPDLFDFMAGADGDLISLFRDRAEVTIKKSGNLPPEVDRNMMAHLGRSFTHGRLEVLGIWGSRHGGQDEVPIAIAAAAKRRLRRWLPSESKENETGFQQDLPGAIQTATALGAILWIQTDPLNEHGRASLGQTMTDLIAASNVPVILTGVTPWRPTLLLEARAYAEIELGAPGFDARKSMWEEALPEVSKQQVGDLATRFRLSNSEVRAAANVARTQAQIVSNGHIAEVSDQMDTACSAVTRQHSHNFAIAAKPKRGPDDLILAPALHRQVMEVAQFFRDWSHVAEKWGFGHLMTGEGGIKALFTGDSGTGKTLAAEVIAGELRMPLLKVDLARIVSKWVGETEKHLDEAFREAEDSHAVLFFDEADALFGKRGEVQHGTDRYANLEVSYLLQRLEDHYGLVILASNLKDNIDSAFTRRFQIVLHLPRPAVAERLRIWKLAFPKAAPLEDGIDFDFLAMLDLTGAGIVGSAQTAALLAVESTSGNGDRDNALITMSHLVQAISRQYRREARLLTASDLGQYASLLQEAE